MMLGSSSVEKSTIGTKTTGLGALGEDTSVQVAVDLECASAAAVRALGFDGQGQRFAAQVPLHEGRRYRVDRSSGVDLLAACSNVTRCGVSSTVTG